MHGVVVVHRPVGGDDADDGSGRLRAAEEMRLDVAASRIGGAIRPQNCLGAAQDDIRGVSKAIFRVSYVWSDETVAGCLFTENEEPHSLAVHDFINLGAVSNTWCVHIIVVVAYQAYLFAVILQSLYVTKNLENFGGCESEVSAENYVEMEDVIQGRAVAGVHHRRAWKWGAFGGIRIAEIYCVFVVVKLGREVFVPHAVIESLDAFDGVLCY